MCILYFCSADDCSVNINKFMTKSDTYDGLCIYLWYLFINDLRYIMNSNDKIAYELLGKLYLVLVDVSLF